MQKRMLWEGTTSFHSTKSLRSPKGEDKFTLLTTADHQHLDWRMLLTWRSLSSAFMTKSVKVYSPSKVSIWATLLTAHMMSLACAFPYCSICWFSIWFIFSWYIVLDMSGRSEVWSSSHYMSRKQFVWSTSCGVGERCWSLVKSGSFLLTADKQRHGSVRLFQTWFCESPLPSWLSHCQNENNILKDIHFVDYGVGIWLTALRHCRCRFVTRSKRPVQCLGQNDRHVTSKHGVGFDIIQKVKKSIDLTSFSRLFLALISSESMLPSLSWSRKAQIRIQTFSAQKCKRRECLSSSSKTPKKLLTLRKLISTDFNRIQKETSHRLQRQDALELQIPDSVSNQVSPSSIPQYLGWAGSQISCRKVVPRG